MFLLSFTIHCYIQMEINYIKIKFKFKVKFNHLVLRNLYQFGYFHLFCLFRWQQ